MRMLGFVLIVLGVVALAYQGFTYTDREKVLDVGPLEATVAEKNHVSIPPVVGGIVLAAGLVLVFTSRRRTA